MSRTRAYTHDMRGWWQRHPVYRRYLLREGSSLFLALYALWLLLGLLSLAAGEAAYEQWRAWHGTPGIFGLHLAVLLAVLYHAWTWLQLLPLTVPPVRLGGRRLPDRVLTRGAWAGSALLSAALWLYLGGSEG
ncbi:MAG: fumarate reductase subunit C [Halorhodospira sp.]